MKDRKKSKGPKARVQASKKRLAYIGTAITVTILVAIIAASGFLIYLYINSTPNQTINPEQGNNPSSQLKAAIVDHLSLSAPNQTFIQTATNILEQAGYTVDYYSGEKVTVGFYRNLPTHGYRMIILRVHSTAMMVEETEGPVALFTSERYDIRKHAYEQLTYQLVKVAYSEDEMEKGITYFGTSPPFVTQSMKDKFQNTTIIMMGCEGLHNPSMAQAFVKKGAKVYISWNGAVSASHTDIATTHLLQHLLIEKLTLNEAVKETFKEVGFDPTYDSLLIYYPGEVGDQTIEDITGNPSTNT